MFFMNSTMNSRKMELVYNKTAKNSFKFQTTFAYFDCTDLNSEDFSKFGIKTVPSFYMFIEKHKKHYAGNVNSETLTIWIQEVLEAKPVIKKSKHDIDHIDKHYFVYVSALKLNIFLHLLNDCPS